MARMHVNAGALNIRASAGIAPDNVVVSLPFGHPVETMGEADLKRWIAVETIYRGSTHRGFVNVGYLRGSLSFGRENLISVAAEIWDKFDRGKGKETISPYSRFVAEMWKSVDPNLKLSGTNQDMPWAGAFIAHILKSAGFTKLEASFPSSRLLHQTILAASNGSSGVELLPLRASLVQPDPGDLIVSVRGDKTVDFDVATKTDTFQSHTDLVVAKGMTQVWAVGGNIANSVSLVRFPLLANGLLDTASTRAFAVMKNRR